MFEALFTAEGLIALLTLTFLEVVLGIDNIIFISILTNKLPAAIRAKARTVGIGLALLFRIIMLLGITWIIGFTEPIFTIFNHDVTGRDAILFIGGLFLLAKSTKEIHHKISPDAPQKIPGAGSKVSTGFLAAIVQIALLDIVFSFDSILTAIGMTNNLVIMIIAVIISLVIMLIFSGRISAFIEKHVSLQILALSFLILIGVLLIAESAGSHVPKGYIYFAVAFSLIVELVNMRADKKRVAQESSKKN
jgi:predicted tellurium resistance membrane protein TerC